MPAIDRLNDSFDDRNLFLQASLGLISLCRRWATLFDDRAPPLERATPPCDHASEVTPVSPTQSAEAIEDAWLGLISLSREILAHAERARCPPAPANEPREIENAESTPARLRRLLV